MADTLALPLHHVVGKGEERRRPLPEHAEPLLGSVDQHLRLPPRGLAAVDSRIGRLLLALVAPGGLAQLLEAPFDVEDIIHDLEGEPEIATRLGDRRHGLRVAAREPRAHAERGAHEGGGLVTVDVLERLGRDRLRSEEHTSELQSPDHLVCRLLLEKKKNLPRATGPRWPRRSVARCVRGPSTPTRTIWP